MSEILVLGPSSSGKTLLVRRLTDYDSGQRSIASEYCIPTVGVEIKSLEVPVPKTDNPKDNNSTEVIKLREVGASLASRWHVHIPYASAIMFTVDASDPSSFAAALVLFHETICMFAPDVIKQKQKFSPAVTSDPPTQAHKTVKPVALVFTHVDMCDPAELLIMKRLFRLTELASMFPTLAASKQRNNHSNVAEAASNGDPFNTCQGIFVDVFVGSSIAINLEHSDVVVNASGVEGGTSDGLLDAIPHSPVRGSTNTNPKPKPAAGGSVPDDSPMPVQSSQDVQEVTTTHSNSNDDTKQDGINNKGNNNDFLGGVYGWCTTVLSVTRLSEPT